MSTTPEEPAAESTPPTPPNPPQAPGPPAPVTGGPDVSAVADAAKAAYGDAVTTFKTGTLTQKLGLAAGVGAVLAFIAAVLPWASVEAGPFDQSSSGFGDGGDGILTFILALAAGTLGVLYALRGMLAQVFAIGCAVAGALITLISVIDLADISDAGGDLEDIGGGLPGFSVDVSAGIGLYLTLLIGLGYVAIGVLAILTNRKTA